MGILFSRFRKKKTTIEVLEDLDTKIKEIQRYGQTTEQRHKKIVGTLIIWSVVLYIIAALVFYFYFFPASLRDRFFYITPLLIFPLLIVLTKRMVTWYYNRKISRNRDKLSTMQQEKKKILDEVTETETYKKAKEILMKFAPDQLRMTPLSPQQTFTKPTAPESPRRPSTPQAVVAPLPGGNELRRRALTVSNPSANVSIGRQTNLGVVPVGVAPAITPQRQTPYQPSSRSFNAANIGARSPLPRPILPQQRSYLDRLVEYLVGDGPSNRYALICQMCESHNGMALKEEFEFFGFRCCYCNFWNPARKQKPSAPRLEDPSSPQSNLQSPKISDLEISSASSSSVKINSAIPNPSTTPCIEVPNDPEYTETPTSLPLQSSTVEKIFDPRKRRRTIYQMKCCETSDPSQDSHTPENYSFWCNEREAKKYPKGKKVKRLGKNSDIEVMEKPSEQSGPEREKDRAMDSRIIEEKESTNVDEGREEVLSNYKIDSRVELPSHRRIRLRESILNAENVENVRKSKEEENLQKEKEEEKEDDKQNEKMEVDDESPQK